MTINDVTDIEFGRGDCQCGCRGFVIDAWWPNGEQLSEDEIDELNATDLADAAMAYFN